MLIGSMRGEKIMLLSSLAQWYLKHGLIISKIYQIVQFKPINCFQKFCEFVSNARRMGDACPTKALLADTAKLFGNSVYGKMITNKEKHREVSYTESQHKASHKIMDYCFVSLEEPCNNFLS